MAHGGRRPGAGRPKGKLDLTRRGLRASLRARLVEIVEAGADPVDFLVNVVNDRSVDLETRISVAQFLTPFVYPRQHGCPPRVDDVVQRVAKTEDVPT